MVNYCLKDSSIGIICMTCADAFILNMYRTLHLLPEVACTSLLLYGLKE